MSSFPLVKFVDAISSTATVRYDCNDQAGTPSKKVTEFDPGVPTLEGDPDAVGQQWGFRSPSITHTIKGTKAQAMAALSAATKEMLRRTNWLLFQPSAAQQPVWFKTYRTGYQPITLDQVWVRTSDGGQVPLADTWKIVIPLVTDAFLYGVRQNLATFQVIQGPTDLTGPTRTAMRVVLPAIKGDAPTALRVTVTPGALQAANDSSAWLLGCIAGTASMTDTIVDIGTGDTVTNISGTAGGLTDATNDFGGSHRVVTIGAATPNLINRFSIALPNTIAVGRYKVLLRCRYTASAIKILLFRLQQWANAGSGVFSNGPVTTVETSASDNSRPFWVDLGEFSFPFGVNPPSDAGGTMPSPVVAVQIGTSDGSASSVSVDSIKLVPIDGPTVTRTTILKTYGPLTGAASGTVAGTFDGDLETYWGKSSGVYVESSPALRGYFPVADPAAAQNLLLVMALDGGAGAGSNSIAFLNNQAAVDVSYYPRYLWFGDGT